LNFHNALEVILLRSANDNAVLQKRVLARRRIALIKPKSPTAIVDPMTDDGARS
jgi:hypothetical protein